MKMKPDMDFDTLLMQSLMDYKINTEDSSLTGFVNTEESFQELMTNIQACGYCYSVRGSHVYSPAQKSSVTEEPTLTGDELSDFNNFSDTLKMTPSFAGSKTSKQRVKRSIHFKSQQGSVPIPYFGLGFSIERITYLECSQGPHYYKKKLHKGSHFALQDNGVQRVIKRRNTTTKKRNCPAVIVLKCIRIYPEFTGAGPNEPHWKVKREVADEIRGALISSSEPLSFLRYYIKASPQSSHFHESEEEKQRRLIHKYEVKKERSRRYKKDYTRRRKKQQETLLSPLLLKNIIETPSSFMPLENNYISKDCIQKTNLKEELEEQTVKDQLELEEQLVESELVLTEHVVTEDDQVVEIEVLEDLPSAMEEQSEMEKTQVIKVADEHIDTLLSHLQNEAQKVITLSSNCKNVHKISQAISLLKRATLLMENPAPVVSTNPDFKRVKIPINEVFTSHSDNCFTFRLTDSLSKPTCVVFV